MGNTQKLSGKLVLRYEEIKFSKIWKFALAPFIKAWKLVSFSYQWSANIVSII
jgi:hypothetical protein